MTSPLRTALLGSLLDAAALVAPVDCAGCGAPDRALCPACAAGLAPAPRTALLDVAPGWSVPLTAGIPYEGVARAVILALKEDGRTELARPLRAPLLAALDLAFTPPAARGALLVPVPGSPAGLGRRGFQPVELLARRAGLATTRALAVVPEAGSGAQKHRTLAARTRERAEPRVVRRLHGRSVVLLDDVVTSGATLRAAARALARAGAAVVGCAAIAATPRRDGESAIPWTVAAASPATVSTCIGDAGSTAIGAPVTLRAGRTSVSSWKA
ncbi:MULTISPECIES: ComF family protein [unclassified Microcella]|uniref:ComF family protein n=1 Tax=unclassified Microcella TaxID=2630066 RepID=UPI0006F63DBE|nr:MULTISPECIES: phosphoribosyltransferase family protein [unclassified Microcella]KQV24458.1 hypothetical protein ASC54_07860 [Yonghaparkia sp. Root332]KRF30750.1 hypothetical protein ASG83_07690 [Yonghaparkia sp. Soil809]